MLKSAKNIKIRAKNIQSYDAFVLSPMIDINGLILRADKETPKEYIDFLSNQDAKVMTVKIDDADEPLVLLTGNFNITRREVEDFLISIPEIVSVQNAELDKLQPAIKLYETIANEALNDKGRFILQNSITQDTMEITPACIFAGYGSQAEGAQVGVNMRAGGNVQCRASRCKSGTIINMNAQNHINLEGKVYGDIQEDKQEYSEPGIMDLTCAVKNVFLAAGKKVNIKNAMVLSGEEIQLDAGINGVVEMLMDKNVDWLNNPHRAFFTPMLSKARSQVTLGYEKPPTPIFPQP